MNPGERVDLIKEISQRMNQEEWPLVDMILQQFEMPTSETWSGDKIYYISEMLKDSSDEWLK